MILDEYMPSWRWHERHERLIAATADRAFETILQITWADAPVFRWLFGLRSLAPLPKHQVLVDQMRALGFIELGRAPGRELVLGCIGRFWTATGGLVALEGPDEFKDFDRPGYAKAALNFACEDRGGATHVTTETRILATDSSSARWFGLYWAVVRPFSGVVRRSWLRAIGRRAR